MEFSTHFGKINYHIHTDAIKDNLIPDTPDRNQISFIYAKADVLNMALLGQTAKQWSDENPDKKGYVRDYATIEQLVVLSNMESTNALLIQQEMQQSQRLVQLNQMAITQMKSLLNHRQSVKKLK